MNHYSTAPLTMPGAISETCDQGWPLPPRLGLLHKDISSISSGSQQETPPPQLHKNEGSFLLKWLALGQKPLPLALGAAISGCQGLWQGVQPLSKAPSVSSHPQALVQPSLLPSSEHNTHTLRNQHSQFPLVLMGISCIES